MDYDVFICHASEDKQEFVDPLAKALGEAGLKVWYDRFVLKLGDDIAEKIDQGLANSRYGVVVLSKTFLAKKKWTKAELNALVNRQASGGKKVILPIWHNITPEEVANYSPILAGKVAVRSQDGLEVVVAQILDVCSDNKSTEAISVFQRGTELGLRGKCLEIIRQDNIIEWRKLVKELAGPIPEQIKKWKSSGESAADKGNEAWEQALMDAAMICLPGFIPIFAAIETGKKDFWTESLGILRRLAILESEMGGGTICALNIGNHMLYVAGSIGMAIAANLKLLDLVNEWMQMKIPDRHEGEKLWLQVRSAYYLPEGIGFDAREPFDFLKKIYDSEDVRGFFPNPEAFVDSILIANLACSLIELRACSQNQRCLEAFMGESEFFSPKVWPVWCLLLAERFRLMTLDLFGDSQGVIRFVNPSGFMNIDKFWSLWKRWKQRCSNLWWQSSSGRYEYLMKIPWMLLPGEPAD